MEATQKVKKRWFMKHPLVPAIVLPLLGLIGVSLASGLLLLLFPPSLEPSVLAVLLTILNDVLRIALAFLVVGIIKYSWRDAFQFGLGGKNLGMSLALASFGLLVALSNLLQYGLAGTPLQPGLGGIALALLSGLAPGIFEEIVCRGAVLTNCIIQWREKPGRILRSLLVSSIVFGLLHLINLAQADLGSTIVQVFYAAALGIFFGAVYLRTRNLWGSIIVHAVIDFTSYLFIGSGTSALGTVDLLLGLGITILYACIGLFLVRPSKREEIQVLWS